MEEKKEVLVVEQTVPQILEEVVGEICDNYCRFPKEIEDEGRLGIICEHCPLNKLI